MGYKAPYNKIPYWAKYMNKKHVHSAHLACMCASMSFLKSWCLSGGPSRLVLPALLRLLALLSVLKHLARVVGVSSYEVGIPWELGRCSSAADMSTLYVVIMATLRMLGEVPLETLLCDSTALVVLGAFRSALFSDQHAQSIPSREDKRL